MKNIYMKVTADEYELPLFVAETVRELAEMTGTTENNIRSSISKRRNGRANTHFLKVQIEEGDE